MANAGVQTCTWPSHEKVVLTWCKHSFGWLKCKHASCMVSNPTNPAINMTKLKVRGRRSTAMSRMQRLGTHRTNLAAK